MTTAASGGIAVETATIVADAIMIAAAEAAGPIEHFPQETTGLFDLVFA